MSWDEYKLETLFDVARGGSPRPIQEFLTDAHDGLNWIMIGDAKSGKYIEKTAKKIKKEGLTKTRIVKKGGFLLSNSMSFGKPYILKIDGCIHDGWLVLSPKLGNIEPDFYYYLLGSELTYRKFSSLAAGAVVKNLNTNIVKNIKIPLPPLTEQKRIADILDAADVLRTKRRQAIAMLDEFLQASFLEMFGDPVTNPKGWEHETMCNVITILSDYHANGSYETLKKVVELKDTPDFALMVRTTDLESKNFDVNVKYITEKAYTFLEKSKIYGKEIIINKIGSAGKVYLMPCLNRPVSLGMNAFLLRFDEKIININYIYYFLTSAYATSEILKRVKGAVTKTIRKDAVREIPILLPPLELQTQFAKVVEQVETQKAQQKAHLAELDTLFGCLQQRAFSGEL